jgi:hypothetical protein
LWRRDAQRLQRVLQGLLIAHEKGIDSSKISKEDLLVLLSEIGHPTK